MTNLNNRVARIEERRRDHPVGLVGPAQGVFMLHAAKNLLELVEGHPDAPAPLVKVAREHVATQTHETDLRMRDAMLRHESVDYIASLIWGEDGIPYNYERVGG